MLVLYLPFLIGIGRITYRYVKWPKRVKLPVFVGCLVLLFFLPVIDVMNTGLDMHYYCENEQGEHIYRTDTTNSLYGQHGVSLGLIKAGMEFVETTGPGGQLIRVDLVEKKIKRTSIKRISSKFEIVYETIGLGNNVDLVNWRIEDRKTGEVLGETKKFRAKAGWLDKLTPSLRPILFWCSKPYVYKMDNFVLKVLIPKK